MRYASEMYGIPEADLAAVHRRRVPAVETNDHPRPRLEHDRWIVDCRCGSGAGVDRAGVARCFECGTVMGVVLPSLVTRQQVETLLASRPERHRNWRPDGETLADLQVENHTHGG